MTAGARPDDTDAERTILGPWPLGRPVRTEWCVGGGDTIDQVNLDPERAASPQWPGFAERFEVSTAGAGVSLLHSAVMVALDNHRQDTGDGEWITYTRMRPATSAEAAEVLDAEAQRHRLRKVIARADAELALSLDSPRPADTIYPLRDRSGDDAVAFWRLLHALPHVHLDRDRFRLVHHCDVDNLRVYLGAAGHIWVEDLTFHGVHGLPPTAARRACYAELAQAFGDHTAEVPS